MPRHFTARGPNGELFVRTSRARDYACAVIARRDIEYHAKAYPEHAATLDPAEFERWRDVSWAATPSLAEKERARQAKKPWHKETRVVPASGPFTGAVPKE